MIGKTVRELNVGDSAHLSKTISESDIYLYAGITGNFNPVHLNEEYARNTPYQTRIAHPALTAGYVGAVMANHLPGPGTIYLTQKLNFLAPVRIGDTITANAEILEINIEENRVRVRTTCTNQHGEVVLDGYALVSPPKAQKE